jgi:thiamine-phosphate pyrophosphorylase
VQARNGFPLRVDWRLCFIADSDAAAGRDLLRLISGAVAGGATIVQLRGKAWTDREFLGAARRVQKLLRARRVPLIINDRADIARAAGAAGVHLGPSDLPAAAAREIVGAAAVIGVSVRSVREARAAERAGADYLGAGPVFATRSKDDAGAPLGLEGLRRLRRAVRLPILAIGGLDAANAPAVIGAGADGLAVISAITAAADPERETSKIIESIGILGIRRRPPRPGRAGGS